VSPVPHRFAVPRSLGLLAVAALLPIILFAAASAVASLRQQSAALERGAFYRARMVSNLVDHELMSQLDDAEALTQLPALDGPPDLAAFREIAQRMLGTRSLWLGVTLSDVAGNRLVGTGKLAPGPVVDPDSYRKAIESKKPVIGSIGPWFGSLGLPLRAPVVRNDAVIGVVTVIIRPNSIREMLAQGNVPEQWVGTVTDAGGRIVARTVSESAFVGQLASERALNARLEGEEGTYEGYTLEGLATISIYRTSQATGWSILIGVPKATYRAPLVRSIWLTLGAGVASLVLAGLFALLLLREIRLRRGETLALEQARRMESLGRLTGGVAHDFNNLLAVILGNLEILERRIKGAGSERPLQSIRRAAERGAEVTRELLAFSRGVANRPRVIAVNERVRVFLGMVGQSLRPDIAVEATLADDLPSIAVDPVQLELALLNVAVNARDAMPAGGTIRVSTSKAVAEDGSGRPGVAIRIADSGVGMPADVLPHVFEPFFTTKEVGKGTGLGLSQVYGFAKHAGGSVSIDSKPKHGTSVTIFLPAAAQDAPAATGGAADPAVSESARLLVVDDNADVRTLAADYLKSCGYEVDEEPDAAGAIAQLERGAFSAVVSDIVMPGPLDGIGLARAVRERWPETAVILVSGYSNSVAHAQAQGLRVLSKPYRMDELAAAVRDAVRNADSQPSRREA